MAKDPAINWYFDNWDGGTKLMTRHQKGCYMDVLSAQFHSGPLSLENIKTVLGSDFQAAWPIISKKFAEKDGQFFNERLEAERKKRFAYSESRSKNRKNKKDVKNISESYETDMNNHMKNIPGIGIGTEIKKVEGGPGEENPPHELSDSGFWLDELPKDLQLTPTEIQLTIEFISHVNSQDISPPEVIKFWEAFKINNFSKREWKNSHSHLIAHFRDSLKYQIKNLKSNGKNQQNHTHKPVITGTAQSAGTL